MIISIRGNSKIYALEQRIQEAMPEPLSRNKLMCLAIRVAAQELDDGSDVDWEKAHRKAVAVLEESSFSKDDIPTGMHADINNKASEDFERLRENLRDSNWGAANCPSVVQNRLLWQLLLANLLIQQEGLEVHEQSGGKAGEPQRMLGESNSLELLKGVLNLIEEGNRRAIKEIQLVIDKYAKSGGIR